MVEAELAQLGHRFAHEIEMAAREDREADDMRLGLLCLGGDFGGRKADAFIDDLHAHFAPARGNLLGAVGVAIKARLAEHIGQCTAQGFGHAGHVCFHLFDVFLAAAGHHEGDARGRAELAEHLAQHRTPLSGRDAGLGAGDGGFHDIAVLGGGSAQLRQGRFSGGIVARGTPGFQVAHLHRLFGGVDRLDGAVATAQGAWLGLGEPVDADHGEGAGLDCPYTVDMGANQAFLHEADSRRCPADLVDLRQRGARLFLQLLGLRRNHMAAIEDVFKFQKVGLIGENLLQAERPLLVPGARQAHRLVPGRQLQRAAAGALGQRHREGFHQDAVDIVLRLRLGQPQRVHLHAIAEQECLGIGNAIPLPPDLFPEIDEGAHLAEFRYETNSRIHEEGDAPEYGFKV